MTNRKTYSTRRAAVRAARQACKVATHSEWFQAFEGPDYYIHPTRVDFEDRFYFELSPVMIEVAAEAA